MLPMTKLLDFEKIVIQCHDNPDADAIASGFALHAFLQSKGKEASFVYGGRNQVTKPNLLEMIRALSIPLRPAAAAPENDALVLVDCQYGAGNVTKIPARTVFVFDHHQQEKSDFTYGVILPYLGSCSTLIWDGLRREGFDFAARGDVATALYYGLYTDTANLAEIGHPLDKDMRDNLRFDQTILKKLKNSILSFPELRVAGTALTDYQADTGLRFAVFKSAPCDPNILGFISDLALQVSEIDLCVVYNETPAGLKLSVRACVREIMASECAEFITAGVGSGGGHREKAGGFISQTALTALGAEPHVFLEQRLRDYLTNYDLVEAANHNLDIDAMPKYIKKKIPVLFVPSLAVFPKGTPMILRTLEGDADIAAADDIVVVVGILGEAYPMKIDKFERSYRPLPLNEKPAYAYNYSPTVRNKITGESLEFLALAAPCLARGEVCVRAARLTRHTKVFTAWNAEGYMSGKPGDYIAVRCDDHNDVYIIREDVFAQTYEPG
ncbi:MAG: DHH family phosphoesterase [Gracilibacteraceae bacterium]|nr:DHH family phosphoesterase [Gracilibacteraceae bacterium]